MFMAFFSFFLTEKVLFHLIGIMFLLTAFIVAGSVYFVLLGISALIYFQTMLFLTEKSRDENQ